MPVGGEAASFLGASNLLAAIEQLLISKSARSALLSVTLSMSEFATNSSGFASISFLGDDRRRQANYVSQLAVSLLQPGSDQRFNPEPRHTPAARQLVLDRRFFDVLATEMANSLSWPTPARAGTKYDSDDARRARLKALDVRANSRFLNIGVNTQVTWPKLETLVQFDQYHLVLMPKTAESSQSVHIDLFGNKVSDQEAVTIINRFLSIMTWCSDQFAITEGGWSGNPVPVAVPRRNLAFATASHWAFSRSVPQSENARRALSHYREARNAEEAGLVSYAVLSYVKIIELRHGDNGAKVKRWIAKTMSLVRPPTTSDPALAQFDLERENESAESYIWSACRVAVAHASIKHPSDVDNSAEVRRLHTASYVLRKLARYVIATELGISDIMYSDFV